MKSKRLSIYLILGSLTALLALAVPGRSGPQSGAIQGKVLDAAGTPLPGAEVSLTSEALPQDRSTLTATDGTFSFDLLPRVPMVWTDPPDRSR